MKLPNLTPERWFPSLSPRLASGLPDAARERFQPMYFSSRSGGGDDGGYDDDETLISEEAATDTPARSPRTRGASGRGGDGGRQRTIQFQPDDRYWTEYLRIALPIIGLILMLGLFWYWATLIIGDDTDNTTDPVGTEAPGLVQTTEATDIPQTPEPTQAVENTPAPTEPSDDAAPTEDTADTDVTEEPSGDEPTEESVDEEPTEEETTGDGFASGDTVVINDDGVNMRSDPTTSEGDNVVTTLNAGDELTIVEGPEEADDYTWYEVTDGTEQGWVVADFIELAD